MPDGCYPIRSAKDVANAVRDYCRTGEKADVKAHIIARAKAIGADERGARRLDRKRPIRWPVSPIRRGARARCAG